MNGVKDQIKHELKDDLHELKEQIKNELKDDSPEFKRAVKHDGEHAFTTRVPAGSTTLKRDCDLIRSVTNVSEMPNSVCIRIGIELVWSAVLLGGCTLQLLGEMGIPVIRTEFHNTTILCEHDVDLEKVLLPLATRRDIAQMETVISGNIAFVAGEARNLRAPHTTSLLYRDSNHPGNCA